VHDEQRQRRGDDVAGDGKEPDQRIQAEAHAGARDDERGVEQGRKRVDPGNAGAPGAGARQVIEAETIGGGHVWDRGLGLRSRIGPRAALRHKLIELRLVLRHSQANEELLKLPLLLLQAP
jgi:hypothetical protein